MACLTPVTIRIDTPIGPLDQAIYSSGEDKIFAVGGQYVYKLNATTGALESKFRFADGVLGESSIVEVSGFLYIGFYRNVLWQWDNTAGDQNPQDIYKVDYDFTTVTPLGLDFAEGDFSGPHLARGYSNLIAIGTIIYGADRYNGLFSVDPTSIGGFQNRTVTPFQAEAVLYDLVHDSTNDVLWAANWNTSEIYALDINVFSTFDASVSTPTLIPGISGVCYCVSNTKVYGVKMDRTVIKANANEALPVGTLSNFTFSTLADILSVGSKPVKIKYNALEDLIYIPTWAGDTVEVLDPDSDTITSVKTGFQSPFDIVFTGSKKFAVERSARGLVEIT